MKWVRAIGSVVLGVIAVIGLLCSVIGFWARDTVFDEGEVAGAVESAIEEPAVTDALAARLTASVMSAVDLETRLNDILPPALQRITPAIVGGLEQRIEDRLSNRLADPDTRDTLVSIFERSYGAFLDVMKGDGLSGGLTVEHGEVTVNFLPLVANGLQTLQGYGLLDDATIPELTRDGDPAEQIAQLEDGLGRDLPDDFGQIVVYRSDSLAEKSETLQRAHFTDLPLAALTHHHPQPRALASLGLHPNLGRSRFVPILHDHAAPPGRQLLRVRMPGDEHAIFLFVAEARVRKPKGQIAIIGHQDEPLAIPIQAADRI